MFNSFSFRSTQLGNKAAERLKLLRGKFVTFTTTNPKIGEVKVYLDEKLLGSARITDEPQKVWLNEIVKSDAINQLAGYDTSAEHEVALRRAGFTSYQRAFLVCFDAEWGSLPTEARQEIEYLKELLREQSKEKSLLLERQQRIEQQIQQLKTSEAKAAITEIREVIKKIPVKMPVVVKEVREVIKETPVNQTQPITVRLSEQKKELVRLEKRIKAEAIDLKTEQIIFKKERAAFIQEQRGLSQPEDIGKYADSLRNVIADLIIKPMGGIWDTKIWQLRLAGQILSVLNPHLKYNLSESYKNWLKPIEVH